MTNTFIPTLGRQPLYCVWIKTGNPSRPLACVWIDPQFRSFQFSDSAVEGVSATPARIDACEWGTLSPSFQEQNRVFKPAIAPAFQGRESKIKTRRALGVLFFALTVLCVLFSSAWADVAGRISGVVSDPGGAFVAGAAVTLTNVGNGTKEATTTNDQGQYSFLIVPIGRYELEINSPGFQPYKKIGVVIDVNSALHIDATLQIKNSETVEVSDSVITIQMSDTEIGETITGQHVAEAPLNGRSYTDLLATQAGVSPIHDQRRVE
jgi:hypothetical protein